MKQSQRRIYLIRALLDEMPAYRGMKVPEEETDQQRLLRSLLNVRPPHPAALEFLEVQDAYLSEWVRERGITDVCSLKASKMDDRVFLWQGDITTLQCDAIVNAANSALLGCFQPCHSCIDNMIHSFAGVQLRIKCNEIMLAQGHEEATGTAKITPAYNLPCKYVLHTVGPIIQTGHPNEKQKAQLASCYRSCLELAAESGCKSVAFCCISTGVFMFPNQLAAEIAAAAVKKFLAGDTRIERVIFNVFKDLDREIYEALLGVC